MHNKKGADYGKDEDSYANVKASEEWGIDPWIGCLIRATDKIRRLQKAARGGTLVNEGIEDSLLDAAVYFIIALDLFRQGKPLPGQTVLYDPAKDENSLLNRMNHPIPKPPPTEDIIALIDSINKEKVMAVDIDDTNGTSSPLRIAVSSLSKEIVPGSALDTLEIREALARDKVGCFRLDLTKENIRCYCIICNAERGSYPIANEL